MTDFVSIESVELRHESRGSSIPINSERYLQHGKPEAEANLPRLRTVFGRRLQRRLRADAHHPANHSARQDAVQKYQQTVEPSNDPDHTPALKCTQRRAHDFIGA